MLECRFDMILMTGQHFGRSTANGSDVPVWFTRRILYSLPAGSIISNVIFIMDSLNNIYNECRNSTAERITPGHKISMDNILDFNHLSQRFQLPDEYQINSGFGQGIHLRVV